MSATSLLRSTTSRRRRRRRRVFIFNLLTYTLAEPPFLLSNKRKKTRNRYGLSEIN